MPGRRLWLVGRSTNQWPYLLSLISAGCCANLLTQNADSVTSHFHLSIFKHFIFTLITHADSVHCMVGCSALTVCPQYNSTRRMAIANGTCVSFCTFWPRLGTPLGQSRYMLHGWKEDSMLVKRIAVCTIYIFNRLRAIARYWSEIATFSYPLAFNAPVGVFPLGFLEKVWSSEN